MFVSAPLAFQYALIVYRATPERLTAKLALGLSAVGLAGVTLLLSLVLPVIWGL